MRRLGYRIVDEMVAHWTTVSEKPVMQFASRATLEDRLREPLPEEPVPIDQLLEQLQRDVWPNIGNVIHPRFFAFIPSPANFVSVMADALAASYNPFAGNWLEGSGPAQIELVTIDWLREMIGLPAEGGGLFVSGGSVANLTALATAIHHFRRNPAHQLERATVYFSDQTHASVDRALKALGIATKSIRRLPADQRFRLPVDQLREMIQSDRRAGLQPLGVIANAGTTNTGAVDPLEDLASLCAREEIWLHADGAYGAAAALAPRGRSLLRGLERVDSLSLDPHKWLFQPFEIGCVLVRDAHLLREAWNYTPEYLKDTQLGDDEVNFYDYGLQLTRGFRALKLWLSLKTFGARAFRGAIEHGFHLAELAEELIRQSKSLELMTPAEMGIVCFRYRAMAMAEEECNEVNRELVQSMIGGGFAFANSTTLGGRVVIRLCPINPRTTEKDIIETLRWIEELGENRKGRKS